MKQQELLWKYVEGNCTSEESALIEKMLAEQPDLQAEIDMISELNTALSNLEAAGPSMRFSKNVMEALPPNLYPPISIESLVHPRWKKAFWASIALFTIATVLNVIRNGFTGNALPYTGEAVDKVNDAVSLFSPTVVQFFVLTIFCLLGLVLMDKFVLSKRINKHDLNQS